MKELKNIQYVLEIILDESDEMTNKEARIYLTNELEDLLSEVEDKVLEFKNQRSQ